jgi:hypothetical protein
MPRKVVKKPASPKNIKKTKKQKKKSELKKRVRRVISKKYSDDSDTLYQSTREIEESSESSLSSSSSSRDSSSSRRYDSSSDDKDSIDLRRKNRKKYEESVDDRQKKYDEESADDRQKDRRKKYQEEESADDRRKKYEEESADDRRKKYEEESADDRRKKYEEESADDRQKDRRKKYEEESADDRQKDRRKKYEEESADDRQKDRRKKYEEESADDRQKDTRKKYEEESADDRQKDRRKKYEESADDRQKDRRKKYEGESADDRQKDRLMRYQEDSVDDRRKKYEEESADDRRKKYEEESADDRRKKYEEESADDRQKDRRKKYEEESADDRRKDRREKYEEESADQQKKYEEIEEHRDRKSPSQKVFYNRESSVDKKLSSIPAGPYKRVEEDHKKDEEDKYEHHTKPLDSLELDREEIDFSDPIKTAELFSKRYAGTLEKAEVPVLSPPLPSPPPPSIKVSVESSEPQSMPEEQKSTVQADRKDFDEKLLESKFQYVYDQEDEEQPEEYYSSKKIEEFILSKGFMILEYFIVNGMCSFILIQLPSICETMMVYVNRKKFPIQVADSSYQKTVLEKLKIEKCEEDTHDYENMTLTGFDLPHTLDTIKETNKQQKSLAYYIYRQISRMMYITKNIEIKPCILLNGIFGFYEIYHMPDRKRNKEFYPVISLESLFSKTFLLEQNVPMFYKRFYSIMTQSNRNKMEYLENSLRSILRKIDTLRSELKELQTKDTDKHRVKALVERLDQRAIQIEAEKKTTLETAVDRVAQSYQIKRLDEQRSQIETKKTECNTLYTEIKKAYDEHVFQHELMFHELYYKIGDMEELLKYLE